MLPIYQADEILAYGLCNQRRPGERCPLSPRRPNEFIHARADIHVMPWTNEITDKGLSQIHTSCWLFIGRTPIIIVDDEEVTTKKSEVHLRGHVHMMSARGGGGVPQKQTRAQILCVSVTVTGVGEGGQKIRKFCRPLMCMPPKRSIAPRTTCIVFKN